MSFFSLLWGRYCTPKCNLLLVSPRGNHSHVNGSQGAAAGPSAAAQCYALTPPGLRKAGLMAEHQHWCVGYSSKHRSCIAEASQTHGVLRNNTYWDVQLLHSLFLSFHHFHGTFKDFLY